MNRKITLTAIAILTCMALFAGGGRLSSVRAEGFDLCIEDDADKGTALRINSGTGDYLFCVGGKSISGKATVVKSGGLVILDQVAADRKLTARIDTAARNGVAALQMPAGTARGAIRDSNTADSSCQCR
ncbi:MAG TPA: hypothetical protein VF723_13555 [Pyrinomonadaceae bacterium]|jgi:hypothetical protein